MRKNIIYILFFMMAMTTFRSFGQHDRLRKDITRISLEAKGRVGVAIQCLEDGDTISYNGHVRQVLHSVFKFPIAVAILHKVDQGEIKLEQLVHISKEDLPENYSPLRDKYPNGNIDLPISELLSYMVSLSDNDVCDIILNKLSSKAEVEKYMHAMGIRPIEIRANEAEMMKAWPAQYTNWSSSLAMLNLIDMTYGLQILSKTNRDYLWKIMEETSTAPKRLKGLLPAGTVVAHKSGTSPTNKSGLSPATNDVGIITLPNGKHLSIVVMVCDAKADMKIRELVIAKIAKAAYDEFNKF